MTNRFPLAAMYLDNLENSGQAGSTDVECDIERVALWLSQGRDRDAALAALDTTWHSYHSSYWA